MRTTHAISLTAAVLLGPTIAVAGPPMICHPVEIGDAQSLPWGSTPFAKSRGYRSDDLVSETIEILDASSSAMVHMETLRRASLYTERDSRLATRLIAALMARALDAEVSGEPSPLAWVDAGYLAQCYDQLGVEAGSRYGSGEVVGYAWVRRGLELSPDDAEIEFTAAMVTALAGGAGHESHVARVRALAAPDSLVSRNLEVHATTYWLHRRHARRTGSRGSPG